MVIAAGNERHRRQISPVKLQSEERRTTTRKQGSAGGHEEGVRGNSSAGRLRVSQPGRGGEAAGDAAAE